MPSVVPTSVRRSAAQQTLALPFRVPPQQWFTLRQAGEVLGLSESTAEKLYDQGAFAGHAHNAGRGERQHKRILRASLIAYLIRTADYTDDSFADLYCSALVHFPDAMVMRVTAEGQRLLKQRQLAS